MGKIFRSGACYGQNFLPVSNPFSVGIVSMVIVGNVRTNRRCALIDGGCYILN